MGAGKLVSASPYWRSVLIVLWCFRWIEKRLPRQGTATLTLILDPKGRLEDEIHSHLTGFDVRIVSWTVRANPPSKERTLRCEMRWTASAQAARPSELPQFLCQLARRREVLGVDGSDGSQSET